MINRHLKSEKPHLNVGLDYDTYTTYTYTHTRTYTYTDDMYVQTHVLTQSTVMQVATVLATYS
ncbi:unnamed protein product [marine sediment metagenome]|uniref:Uncharacterized protein n=1 Tax=marine sediment metagenome TaxID=412755 RepID=X1EM30_9ZZZZ